jgi:hypothetical protein
VCDAIDRQSGVGTDVSGQLPSAAKAATSVTDALVAQVVEIVRENSAFDEIGMAYVVWLRNNSDKPLPAYCETLLSQMAVTRAAQLRMVASSEQAAVRDKLDALNVSRNESADVVYDFLDANRASLDAASRASRATSTVRKSPS